MPSLWEEQVFDSPASGDCHSPGLLSAAIRLSDLGVEVKVVTRVYQRLREALYHLAELEDGKLKGEIELG